ncbi:hypothetical protein D3C85_1598980 [compost metagenome]
MQFIFIHRLQQVIVDPERHRTFGIAEIRIAAEDDDVHLRIVLPQLLNQLQPVSAGHADIDNHQIGGIQLIFMLRFYGVRCGIHDLIAKALPVQQGCKSLPDRQLIIHNQHTIHKNHSSVVFRSRSAC